MDIEWVSLGRALLFLGVPFVLSIFYLQWKWAGEADRNIRVLLAEQGGGGDYFLAPKSGGSVTIHNPYTNEDRTWPVNELATIDVTYPGVGFVPKALQKKIRLAILNEGDWEPILNRSPHRTKVASPDVVMYLKSLAETADERVRKDIAAFINGISTSPTREMIADPATLGNLMRAGIMKALASVGDEFKEAMDKMSGQLVRLASLNPTWVYIGIFLNVILSVFLIYQIMNGGADAGLVDKVDAISKALGIP